MDKKTIKELAGLQDELSKLKPAIAHIDKAKKISLATIEAIEGIKSKYDDLFKSVKGLLKDSFDEYERNVRKQIDNGKEVLKETDEMRTEVKKTTTELEQLIDEYSNIRFKTRFNIMTIIQILTLIGMIVITFLIFKN